MKKLFVYLKDYKKECVVAPLFKALEVAFELLVPLIMAYIIDSGIPEGEKGNINPIVIGCLVLLALGVIGLSCTLIAQFFSANAACGFAKNIKAALFKHVGDLSYSDLDKLGTSSLVTNLTSDVNQIQTGTNLTLRLFLRSPLVVFGAMIMAFTVDAKAAVSFAVVIPALAVVVFGIMLASMPLYKRVQRALSRVLRRTRENLGGVRVVRAFCHEDEEVEAFREENDFLTKCQKFVGRISALLNPLTYVIVNLGIVWLLWSSTARVESGDLSQGEVIALWNYMSQILVELVKLANLIITMTKAAACGNRIGEVLAITPSQSYPAEAPTENADAPAVAFDGVSFSYEGAGAEALTDITFSAMRGETVGIIGGTGSGKSTLINLIPRFYDATKGRVSVNGASVLDYPKDTLLGKIGIVPQKAVLFSGSIRENLLWGKPDATEEECYLALEKAQALDVVKSKGEGLDYLLEEGGKNLSGGQRQRLTIARALVRNPEILILDDAASALDLATDAALRRALAKEECTVFIVSQRIASVRGADKILVLDDGELVAVGTHETLLASSEVYREIYESQYKREEESV